MIFNLFYDTIIFVTLLCTSLKLIINRCLFDTKNKVLITTNEDFGNKKSIKNNKSFNKFNFFEYEEIDNCAEDPQVLLETCHQCKNKIINNNEQTYFAFDKRYCRCCWSSLHNKIFSNHL